MNPAPAGYRKVLILVSGAAFLDFLDVTVVNLAFPSIQRDFPSATVSSLTWVITGYAILFAALLTAAGRLADVLGRKRVSFSASRSSRSRRWRARSRRASPRSASRGSCREPGPP